LNGPDRERALVAHARHHPGDDRDDARAKPCDGVGLLVATLWLVIKGGENVGQNLNLLSNYFPGYSVTWSGSLIGLFYGGLSGAALGWTVARLYNALANRRADSSA
jgi:hypothetical protein